MPPVATAPPSLDEPPEATTPPLPVMNPPAPPEDVAPPVVTFGDARVPPIEDPAPPEEPMICPPLDATHWPPAADEPPAPSVEPLSSTLHAATIETKAQEKRSTRDIGLQ